MNGDGCAGNGSYVASPSPSLRVVDAAHEPTAGARTQPGSWRKESGVRLSAQRVQDQRLPVWLGRFSGATLVASGGEADLYEAEDAWTGEPVALKHLRTDDAESLARFATEARLLAELDHPGLPRYVAYGAAADDGAFLAMEWLGSVSLADRLIEGPLSIHECRALVARLLSVLRVLHARGIVHRDIKPDNIMLVGGDPGDARLVDLGICARADYRRTPHGLILGTPSYMAPEQASGDGKVDARTDLYALGAVLYECLSGDTPWGEGSVTTLLHRLMTESPRYLGDRVGIPRLWAGLVEWMMQRDPAKRPPDTAAVLALLDASS